MENNKAPEAKKPEEKISKKEINGHTVSFDVKASSGARHMKDWVKDEELQAAFKKAAATGSASFKDAYGYGYKLVHHNGTYKIVKK